MVAATNDWHLANSEGPVRRSVVWSVAIATAWVFDAVPRGGSCSLQAGEVENVVTFDLPKFNSAGCFDRRFARRSSSWFFATPGYSLVWLNDVPIVGPSPFGYPLLPSPVIAPPALAPAPAPRQVARAAEDQQPKPAREPRASSPSAKARAGKMMGYGDAHFGNQKYLLAAERYKSAVRSAPDLAEPYIRQALAHAAGGDYESAVKVFRRGLKVRGDWSDSPFRLDDLYGDDRIAKTARLEGLAKAVEANPFDSTLLVALGMLLYFDGHPDRAEVFFARAAQLGANGDRLLDAFLPHPGPEGAPPPQGAPRADGKVAF
jgi:hypothetical protein